MESSPVERPRAAGGAGINRHPEYYRQFGYEMALPLQGGRSAFAPNIRRWRPARRAYRLRTASLDESRF